MSVADAADPYLTFTSQPFASHSFLLIQYRFILTCLVDFIRNYVRHVFTFGSPPVVASAVNKEFPHPNSKCDILDTFGLPVDIIKGYAQPWVSVFLMEMSHLIKKCLSN